MSAAAVDRLALEAAHAPLRAVLFGVPFHAVHALTTSDEGERP